MDRHSATSYQTMRWRSTSGSSRVYLFIERRTLRRRHSVRRDRDQLAVHLIGVLLPWVWRTSLGVPVVVPPGRAW